MDPKIKVEVEAEFSSLNPATTYPDPNNFPRFVPPEDATLVETEAAYREQFPLGVNAARHAALRAHMEQHLRHEVEWFRHRSYTDSTLSQMKLRVTTVLHGYQARGFVPESGCLPISATRIVGTPPAVQVELPTALRLWFEDDTCFMRRFEHDCPACTFLGHRKGSDFSHDFYYCGGEMPTVIARWGNEGPEYESGISIAEALEREHPDHHLVIALHLARDRRLVE